VETKTHGTNPSVVIGKKKRTKNPCVFELKYEKSMCFCIGGIESLRYLNIKRAIKTFYLECHCED